MKNKLLLAVGSMALLTACDASKGVKGCRGIYGAVPQDLSGCATKCKLQKIKNV